MLSDCSEFMKEKMESYFPRILKLMTISFHEVDTTVRRKAMFFVYYCFARLVILIRFDIYRMVRILSMSFMRRVPSRKMILVKKNQRVSQIFQIKIVSYS